MKILITFEIPFKNLKCEKKAKYEKKIKSFNFYVSTIFKD
jgi:hypothetical protein